MEGKASNQIVSDALQILCNLDMNHNGNVDVGEPITLPIGAFTVACNVNPVTVQFALLDPQQ